MRDRLDTSRGSSLSGVLISASIVFAGVLIAGAVLYSPGGGSEPVSTEPDAGRNEPAEELVQGAPPLSAEDVILGSPDAPVTIIEYADYQCPFCERFHSEAADKIRKEYVLTGKVKMVFRNFPFLDQFPGGQNESRLSAEAVECAKDQGKYWAFHDAIFDFKAKDTAENSGNLNRALFLNISRGLSMDTQAFSACFDSRKYSAKVQNDLVEGQRYGVVSTPTIFVNDVKIEGLMPFELRGTLSPGITPYKSVIESELGRVGRSSP